MIFALMNDYRSCFVLKKILIFAQPQTYKSKYKICQKITLSCMFFCVFLMETLMKDYGNPNDVFPLIKCSSWIFKNKSLERFPTHFKSRIWNSYISNDCKWIKNLKAFSKSIKNRYSASYGTFTCTMQRNQLLFKERHRLNI